MPDKDTPVSVPDGCREALAALVAKIDALSPEIDGMFQLATIHGATWPAEKNWVKEMADAKTMLAASPTPQAVSRDADDLQRTIDCDRSYAHGLQQAARQIWPLVKDPKFNPGHGEIAAELKRIDGQADTRLDAVRESRREAASTPSPHTELPAMEGEESLGDTGFLLTEAKSAALEWLNCERHSKGLGPLVSLPDCDDSSGKKNVALRMLRATSIIALRRSRPSPVPKDETK